MAESIFTDNFTEVETNEDLQKIKKRYPYYDPYYIASGCKKERRERFDNLWKIYKPLADKHFLSDIKKHFHQRTWEMYLGAVFIKNQLNILSPNKGPDFIINNSDKIFVEATACEKGETKDRVPDIIYNAVQHVPENEMLIRLVNSLDVKYEKYKNFIKKENKAYIIAINKGKLEHPDHQPLILKCLFAIGYQHFKKIKDRFVYAGWTSRRFVEKKSKVRVPMNFFENQNHNIVSAVIYSDRTVLNHPEEIGSDCIIVHNPNSLNPISLDVFYFLEQYQASYDRNGLYIRLLKK